MRSARLNCVKDRPATADSWSSSVGTPQKREGGRPLCSIPKSRRRCNRAPRLEPTQRVVLSNRMRPTGTAIQRLALGSFRNRLWLLLANEFRRQSIRTQIVAFRCQCINLADQRCSYARVPRTLGRNNMQALARDHRRIACTRMPAATSASKFKCFYEIFTAGF